MTEPDLAFGIDISRWNTSSDGKTKVDFDVIANHPQDSSSKPEVVFIAARAGISWGYQDPWFNYYFEEAQRINRVRMAYHVMFPGERPDRQMDNFFRILGNADLDKIPLVLDLELDHGHSRTRITTVAKECLTIMANRSGRTPFIYSRTSWVNTFLSVGWLPPVHWWLAKYKLPLPYPLYTPEHPTPPYPLPTAVYEWAIQQTGNRGAQIGAPANYFMDYNRWNGSKYDLYKTLGLDIDEPQPITCPIDQKPCTGGRYAAS